MYKYDHIGIIVERPQEGMIYYPEFKVWTSDYEASEYRIEFIYYEEGSKMHPLIQKNPHVCFLVEDVDEAVHGKNVLMEPSTHDTYRMAFIEDRGAIVEFIQNL